MHHPEDYESVLQNDDWNQEGGGHGITAAKLRKAENTILNDDFLWQDVIARHNLFEVFPWNAKSEKGKIYDHAMGNFWGMVHEKICR